MIPQCENKTTGAGPVDEQPGRCCRLTVSAARTNVALLIRRAVRCSANYPLHLPSNGFPGKSLRPPGRSLGATRTDPVRSMWYSRASDERLLQGPRG
jgi:tRNA pseudouridine-54 N-methylase